MTRIRRCLGAWLLLATLSVLPASAQTRGYLVDFKREGAENMLWEVAGVKMGEQNVAGTLQGLGAAGDSRVAYKIDGKWDLLEAWIGYLSTAPKGRRCRFEVMADGQSAYKSEVLASGGDPVQVRVPIKGKNFLVLVIKPESYGSTAGAAWADPTVYAGVRPEDFPQPLMVEINGKRSQVEQPGGVAPKTLMVPIPLTPGSTEYRVKVIHDAGQHKAQIVVEKAKP